MSATIRILPDTVANQIAAGEVVERPASVVKELVENALDAGARRIDVELRQGGRRLIRVADDGSGMVREDALLSLDRHATSKIHSADDLRSIHSFGFRGEALPSIASVSRFTLETRAEPDALGTRIRVRAGTISAVDDLARTPGTTVTVEDLFLNAPVRRKFLNAASAETRAVHEALSPLALAHPEVALSLVSDNRVILELPEATDVIERIAGLWGDEISRQLLAVSGGGEGLGVRGLIHRPDETRAGFRRAYLFLGARPFAERAILKAVDRGYRTTIPEGHRPWVFLFLDAPEGSVDVNVHPTKAEVRFQHLGAVEELVERSVRAALEGEASAATLDRLADRPAGVVRERGPVGRPEIGEAGGREPEPQMALFMSGRGRTDPAGPDERDDAGATSDDMGAPMRVPDDAATESDDVGRPRLWQVHRAWILAEVRDGLLLIDQHAAHERILFERIMRRFDEGTESSQRLLFPLTIRLTSPEYAIVEDLSGLLHKAGFEVEGFGGDTVIVHAVPMPHPGFDAERCLREMVEELTHGSPLMRSARNQYERVAMSFACKGAIKAGQPLDPSEIQQLFDQLFATELPYHDVHGRPTTVRLSRAELDRKFGR